jgi:hypothetical protein
MGEQRYLRNNDDIQTRSSTGHAHLNISFLDFMGQHNDFSLLDSSLLFAFFLCHQHAFSKFGGQNPFQQKTVLQAHQQSPQEATYTSSRQHFFMTLDTGPLAMMLAIDTLCLLCFGQQGGQIHQGCENNT